MTRLLFVAATASAACFFPTELQGSYAVQTEGEGGAGVWYRSLTIGYQELSGLGACHSRAKSGAWLLQDQEADCTRCVTLTRRSHNLVSLGRGECGAGAGAGSCPVQGDEQLLWRAGSVRPAHCPLSGRYRVAGTGGGAEGGALHTCPDESVLSLVAGAGQREEQLQCLAAWQDDRTGQHWLALLDRHPAQVGEAARPRWRCARYSLTAGGREARLQLSSDSTCREEELGAELRLVAEHQPADTHGAMEWPQWAQGEWSTGLVIAGSQLEYRDPDTLTTTSLTAVRSPHPGHYLAASRPRCGARDSETQWVCVRLVGRGGAALELSLGPAASCSPATRLPRRRLLLAPHRPISCPMAGAWRGELPDGSGLCAASSTDCNTGAMSYAVFQCSEPDTVLELRTYQCYAQYAHRGLTYTLTRRTDLGAGPDTQECFVGVEAGAGGHRVLEAGRHCRRGLQPASTGMMMQQVEQAQCGRQQLQLSFAAHPKLKVVQMVEDKETLKTILQFSASEEIKSSSSSALTATFSVIFLAAVILLSPFHTS